MPATICFLIRKRFPATKENIAEFESRKEELLKAAAEKLQGKKSAQHRLAASPSQSK